MDVPMDQHVLHDTPNNKIIHQDENPQSHHKIIDHHFNYDTPSNMQRSEKDPDEMVCVLFWYFNKVGVFDRLKKYLH